jgi:hypothetical protein
MRALDHGCAGVYVASFVINSDGWVHYAGEIFVNVARADDFSSLI